MNPKSPVSATGPEGPLDGLDHEAVRLNKKLYVDDAATESATAWHYYWCSGCRLGLGWCIRKMWR